MKRILEPRLLWMHAWPAPSQSVRCLDDLLIVMIITYRIQYFHFNKA